MEGVRGRSCRGIQTNLLTCLIDVGIISAMSECILWECRCQE